VRTSTLAVVVLLFVSAVLGALLYRQTVQNGRLAEQLGTLYRQARDLEAKSVGGRAQLDSLSDRLRHLEGASTGLDAVTHRELQEQGLDDPVADLVADLQRHPELIPHPGVLGGRMGFRQVRVLSGRWVHADFDDGHIAGEALLEYRVSKPGRITWKVLESRLL
jgi:hypothetical protein